MRWHRHPVAHTGYANYTLELDTGEVLGRVRWCGHPTATYKYFAYDVEGELRTYRTSKEAKAFVEAGRPAWCKPE